MLVRNRMTQTPETVTPQDTLAVAQEKMTAGRFRRLPVVQDSRLVGILTDRDVRRHAGMEGRTKVVAAMTESPLTVSPLTTLEEATQLMLTHQVGGLPVLENGVLVGIITTSDVMHAFLQVTGASTEGSIRIDILYKTGEADLTEASRLVSELGGEVLGVGTYRETWGEKRIFYLRLHGASKESVTAALQEKGYTIVRVHP